MARHPNRNNKPATDIPVDEGEQLHAWQRSMTQVQRETPVTAVPLKAKLVHGIFANRIRVGSRRCRGKVLRILAI